jgi:hypothetical protein
MVSCYMASPGLTLGQAAGLFAVLVVMAVVSSVVRAVFEP